MIPFIITFFVPNSIILYADSINSFSEDILFPDNISASCKFGVIIKESGIIFFLKLSYA